MDFKLQSSLLIPPFIMSTDHFILYFRSLNPAFATLTPDEVTVSAIDWYVSHWNRYPSVAEMIHHSFDPLCWQQWLAHIIGKNKGITQLEVEEVMSQACIVLFNVTGKACHPRWLDNILDIFLSSGQWPTSMLEIDRFTPSPPPPVSPSVEEELDFSDLEFTEVSEDQEVSPGARQEEKGELIGSDDDDDDVSSVCSDSLCCCSWSQSDDGDECSSSSGSIFECSSATCSDVDCSCHGADE